MEYRVYTYSPSRAHTTSHQRRRRIRRRHRVLPILQFVGLLFLVISAFVLFIILIKPAMNLKKGATDRPIDTDTHPESSAVSTADSEEIDSTTVSDPIPDSMEPDILSNMEYDFSSPVPVSSPVENSYFDDVVFIGDSRTEGLILNTGLSNATSYAYKGLMVDTVFTKPVINKNGQKVSVMEALKSTPFSKVYIMLGINETGWVYSHIFQKKYGEMIDGIREVNPEAVIYIQEIMPVSSKVSSTHSYITNAKINEYNGLLRELAEEKQVFYIDTGNAVASADGSLPEDAATDGIHLVKSYCEKWLDYLKTHTTTQ